MINQIQAKRFAELVAKRVHAEASVRGITSKKLSKTIGTGEAILSNYFTGKREMPLSILEKCCQVIGIEPREIVAMAYRDLMREFSEPDHAHGERAFDEMHAAEIKSRSSRKSGLRNPPNMEPIAAHKDRLKELEDQ